MTTIIETQGLTKQYGKLTALKSLNLTVETGAVFGFVGPNGAGKTTTMRILATLLRPTAGEAWVAGHSVCQQRRGVRRAIGYMPDFFGVYGDMKVWEYLDFFAACYEIPVETRARLADDLLELVDLAHRRDDYVDALSRGMKQRLCLARALAHDPQVLILDEPASGLDPRARVEIRELLREMQGMGKTILVSSHILSEIEEICTHIGIIEAGQLVATGTLEEMRQHIQAQRVVKIGLTGRIEEAQAWLVGRPDVVLVEPVAGNGETSTGSAQRGDLQITFAGDDEALARLLSELVGAGFPVLNFREETGDLEDVFMRLTKGIVS
ncbi:MAG: ABC transporter ATP-binding protein [Chloroflexota bacterium]|nr:ABC transporter ATP-binding protein [Chloroflexota bacterium]